MYQPRRTIARTIAALLALGGAAACGGDDTASPSTDPDAVTIAMASTVAASTAPTSAAPTTDGSTTVAPTTVAPTTVAPTTPSTTSAVTTSTLAAVDPGPLEVVTRDYAFEGMPAVLRAGTYQVTVRNEGAELHEFVVYRPTDGKTLEELAEIGPEGFLEHAELAAYLPGVPPGEVLPVDMVLQPGDWTLVCFIPATHDGQPHFTHGMTQTITVVP